MNRMNELRRLIGEIRDKMEELNTQGEAESRGLNETEQAGWDALVSQGDEYRAELAKLEERAAQLQALGVETPAPAIRSEPVSQRGAPAFNRIARGDTEERALAHFVRSGDQGALMEQRASNDTDMNVGTDADGGYGVPTGHYNGIIARRDELMLATQLGCTLIPGKGTTVNAPIDSEADGEFITTSEGSDHDRDAPTLGVKALTLVRQTKKIQISWELLEDEDSRLVAFLENWVARGMAKTHNGLLLTEAAASGTSMKTFASATAIAAFEVDDIEGDDDLGGYLEDDSVSWIMRNSTLSAIRQLTGSARVYGDTGDGGAASDGLRSRRTLLEYPVFRSNKAAAIAASAKSVYFGNWAFMGYREAPGFTLLRDPYSYEAGVELRYQYRAVYGVLQAEAIGYGVHPAS